MHRIYKENIENPFPNSKVEQIVYHSTGKDFDTFIFSGEGSHNRATAFEGLYFADSRKHTFSFGEISYACYINMEYPLIIDLEKTQEDIIGIQNALIYSFYSDSNTDLVKALIDMNNYEDDGEFIDYEDDGEFVKIESIFTKFQRKCDGIIIKNTNYAASHSTEYIIFKNPYNLQEKSLDKRIQIIDKKYK